MKVAVIGASGFLGLRLVPRLLDEGHEVKAVDLEKPEFSGAKNIQADISNPEYAQEAMKDAEAAYYLVHSISEEDFEQKEKYTAEIFRSCCDELDLEKVIYMTGVPPKNHDESEHLSSRRKVGEILEKGDYSYIELRSAMILGEGSASYMLMKRTVDRMKVIPIPRDLESCSSPIYVENVLDYLIIALEKLEDGKYDIGGPEELDYEEILRRYAEARNLGRYFIRSPFSIRTSARVAPWITGLERNLTVRLMESLKHDMPLRNKVEERYSPELTGFEDAVKKIEKVAKKRDLL